MSTKTITAILITAMVSLLCAATTSGKDNIMHAVRSTRIDYTEGDLPTSALLFLHPLLPVPLGETYIDGSSVHGPVLIGSSGTGAAAFAFVNQQQYIYKSGDFIEAELHELSGGQLVCWLGLYERNDYLQNNFSNTLKYAWVYDTSAAQLHVIAGGATVLTLNNTTSQYLGLGQRHSIRIVNRAVHFYIDYHPNKLPVYVHPEQLTFPYVPAAFANYKTQVNNIMVKGGVGVSYEYTEAQQIADFGAPQSILFLRVQQVSTIVGPGYPIDAICDGTAGGEAILTLTSFGSI